MRAGVGTLAAILVGLSSLACGDAGDLEDGVVGAVEDQPAADKADDVAVPFRVVTGGYDFGFPTAKIERETRRVFKTAGALASYFQCTTCNPGIDFSREWAVFYTPGRDALVRGSLATLRSVKLSPAGASLKVTTRHLKPGSCATERTRPFVFAAFKKPTRTPSTTRFYKDDYTRSCASSTSTNVTRAPFARDLRAHLADWYVPHGADVRASRGNTLAQAQAAVDEAKIVEITDPEDDPDAHDLTRTRIFRHPDIVWPGSDIVWFGAYDRPTGRKLVVYDFN